MKGHAALSASDEPTLGGMHLFHIQRTQRPGSKESRLYELNDPESRILFTSGIKILNNCARLRICTESGKLFFGCFSGLKIQQLSSGRGEADYSLTSFVQERHKTR